MRRFLGLFLTVFTTLLSVNCCADDTVEITGTLPEMVERINQRYDSFYQWRREREERENRFQNGREERKNMEREHHAKLEVARQEYVKTRRVKPSDEPLRLQWERGEKERAQNIEMLRRRYVDLRATVERYLKKGRTIPELLEFDLEGY
jgi:hypothetical protein